MKRRSLSIFVVTLLWACSPGPGEIVIEEAWARPGGKGMNSAAYFIIENRGPEDRLLGARSTISERTEIHRSTIDPEGTMRMQEQDFVTLPAASRTNFEPGGLHVMLVSLMQELELNQQIQVQLQFEHSGELLVDVPIQIR